jgi:hypothetical protein
MIIYEHFLQFLCVLLFDDMPIESTTSHHKNIYNFASASVNMCHNKSLLVIKVKVVLIGSRLSAAAEQRWFYFCVRVQI